MIRFLYPSVKGLRFEENDSHPGNTFMLQPFLIDDIHSELNIFYERYHDFAGTLIWAVPIAKLPFCVV